METEKYRKDGSSLYMYDQNSNAYIHVYKNDRYKTLAGLIRAYENECNQEYM